MSTCVVLDTGVQGAVNERLAALLRDDNVGASDDMQDRQAGGQREPVVEGWCLGRGEEAADGNDDCLSAHTDHIRDRLTYT